MKLEKKPINEIKTADYNPRQIDEIEMKKLRNSIGSLGYANPIVVNEANNTIISGNQRYKALKKMGYKEVEVILINEPDMQKEKALNIALNKISGEWDIPQLENVLTDLKIARFDVELTGFDKNYLDNLGDLESVPDFQPTSNNATLDTAKKHNICPSCGHEF
jgi:ParB-like chromosome segregation protein Spo0J